MTTVLESLKKAEVFEVTHVGDGFFYFTEVMEWRASLTLSAKEVRMLAYELLHMVEEQV